MSILVRCLIASQVMWPVLLPWAHGELAGIGPGVGDQLLHRLDRQIGIDRDQRGKAADPRHRREVLDRIVGHALEQAGRGRMRRVGGDE